MDLQPQASQSPCSARARDVWRESQLVITREAACGVGSVQGPQRTEEAFRSLGLAKCDTFFTRWSQGHSLGILAQAVD